MILMPVLSLGAEIEEYYGENLAQPFLLDISVSEGTQILVEVSQKRGDVVLELEDRSTQKIIKKVDFPTEYPFDEITLISKRECTLKCILRIRAKNKIDSPHPFNLRVQSIGLENADIPYLNALSQTAELAHDFSQGPESRSKSAISRIIERLKSALEHTDKSQRKLFSSLIRMRLVESYSLLNNVDDRKSQLLKIQLELEDQISVYKAYSNYELGALETNQNRELSLYELGMKVSQELGQPLLWAIGANYLGTTLIAKGEFTEAINVLAKAEEIFKEQGSIFWMSYPLNNLSWANYRLGQYDTALKYAAQLKLIADSYKDTENELWSLYNLGFIYQQKGDLAAAQKFIDESLDGVKSVKGRKVYKSLDALESLLLKQKSILLVDQGSYEQALDTAKQLKAAVIEQNQIKRIPDVLFLESQIYLELGDIQLAEKTLQESIELSKGSEREIFLAKCYRHMAEIKLLEKKVVAGLEYLTEAINFLATTDDRTALTRLLIYTLEGLTSAGGIEQAAELLPKIDNLVEEHGVGIDRIEYGYRKAEILIDIGSLDRAKNTLANTLDEVNILLSTVKRKDLRRSYYSLQKKIYESLISLTIRSSPNDAKKSLEIAEEFKGLTLEEDLLKLTRNSQIKGDYLERRHYLHSQLLSTSEALISSSDSSVLREARLLSSELEELEAEIEWGNAKTIERSQNTNISPTPDGVTVLYYFLGQKKSWCWVLSGSNVDVVELPNEKVILTQSTPVISTYSIPPSARVGSNSWEDRQALNLLSDTLLEGPLSLLASQGKKPRNLVVIRDGALSNVPYAQLISPETMKYLVEDHAISYATSIESWQHLRQRDKTVIKTNKLGLVASSAAFESGNLRLSSLPNTDFEVSKIANLFGSDARITSDEIDQEISLDQLLTEPIDILHFATHVSLNVEFPYLSFLLLPENSSRERLLLATQISSMRIPVNTVVLSGCETASGKLDPGEGMLSVSRAFIEAGATNVVGSTRKVQDDSSSLLMGYMYEHLRKGVSLAISLQKAQTNFITQHPEFMDPYFWSGYQLMGAGN